MIIIIIRNNKEDVLMTHTCNQQYSRCVVVTRATPTREKVASKDLLGQQGQLTIEHANEDYSLRITKSGKLILTK